MKLLRGLKIALFYLGSLTASLIVVLTVIALWPEGPKPDTTKFQDKALQDAALVTWRISNHRDDIIGTGFTISLGGSDLIVTNSHICQGPVGIAKTLNIYSQYYDVSYLSNVMYIDQEHDLCFSTAPYYYDKNQTIVFIKPPAIPIPSLIDGGDRKLGATYVTVGHPNGDGLKHQSTIDMGEEILDKVSRLDAYCELATEQEDLDATTKKRCEMKWPEVKLSESCIPGQSGSLVMNSQAILVGIINYRKDRHCYMIPIKYMLEDIKKMAQGL